MTVRNLLPTVVLVVFSVLWLAAASLRPQPGQEQIGVVFPPNMDGTEVLAHIADAGGRLVREGAWPFIAVVAMDGADTLSRLEKNGALFTVNPLALGNCLTRRVSTNSPAAAE